MTILRAFWTYLKVFAAAYPFLIGRAILQPTWKTLRSAVGYYRASFRSTVRDWRHTHRLVRNKINRIGMSRIPNWIVLAAALVAGGIFTALIMLIQLLSSGSV
jgi:hypothetical protein